MADRLFLWRFARTFLPTVDCEPDGDPQAVMVVTEGGQVPMATADNPRARTATLLLGWRLAAARIVLPGTTHLAELDGTAATNPFHPAWTVPQLVVHGALAAYEGRAQVATRCYLQLYELTGNCKK